MNEFKPILKEMYGKGVRAMSNTKAPMFSDNDGDEMPTRSTKAAQGKRGGPPTVKHNVKAKNAPPPRGMKSAKPMYCPICNYRGTGQYCPQCGNALESTQAKGMPAAPTASATRY